MTLGHEAAKEMLREALDAFADAIYTVDEWGGGTDCMACGENMRKDYGPCMNHECPLVSWAEAINSGWKALKSL